MPAPINPLLARAAASPIMEAQGWLADAPPPPERPLINLSQAAPALPPPLEIRQHLAEAMLSDESAHFYNDVLGRADLRAQIAADWSTLYGGAIGSDDVAVTAGCNQAFCVAVASACQPGDQVLLPTPWYFNHKMWLDMAGIEAEPLPMGPGMLPDPDEARALIGPRTKALALVTPNNPTGAEYPADLMDAFFDLAQDRGLLLIIDETYRDFNSSPGAPHRLFQREGWREVVAHLYSFSKVYRITGHRTGALIAGPERIAQAEKFLDTVTICPAQPGQLAALHGLRTLRAWVEEQRAEFAARRAVLTRLFAEHLGDWTLHGAGAYFAWATPPTDTPSADIARRLVAEQSLLVLPGAMFLPEDRQTSALRIAFANTDAAGIEEVVGRLGRFHP